MARIDDLKPDADKAADIVRDAGGKVVGRTRLQKVAYLLELAGVGDGFVFEYRHYGPFCEDLASATRKADLLGYLKEEECQTAWGGFYSVFTTDRPLDEKVSFARRGLAQVAAKADSIELELAATAAYLSLEGKEDAWEETARLKPEKVEGGRLEQAKFLYERFRQIKTPRELPEIT